MKKLKKYVCLYNPYSGNYHGFDYAKQVENVVDYELIFKAMPEIDDFKKFFKDNKEDIIICGGDGTLNYFVNHCRGLKFKNEIYYYSTGTGNDFYNDIGNNTKDIINITEYINNLPVVEINDKEYLFLNNVAYGLDGYCCLEGDRQKKKNNKPVNYTLIALKGLFGDYKPTDATITVDGKVMRFNKVWMAPTMNGRYMGGGMMVAPNQERMGDKLSLVVVHDCSRLKLLTILPKVFSGEHIKYTDIVTIIETDNVVVEYDEARPVQIDGEVIPDVKKYTIKQK